MQGLTTIKKCYNGIKIWGREGFTSSFETIMGLTQAYILTHSLRQKLFKVMAMLKIIIV